jgi:hypothetical protein
MKSRTTRALSLCVALLAVGDRAHAAAIAPRRPTPHQRLDAALAPVRSALEQLRATEGERRSVQDLLARGEALAAECVEQRQRGEHGRAAATERVIAVLARVVRGRIEALRAEASADESERRASEGERLAAQARGALERAAERRMLAGQSAERAQRSPAGAEGARAGESASGERPASGGAR